MSSETGIENEEQAEIQPEDTVLYRLIMVAVFLFAAYLWSGF